MKFCVSVINYSRFEVHGKSNCRFFPCFEIPKVPEVKKYYNIKCARLKDDIEFCKISVCYPIIKKLTGHSKIL